MIILLMMILGTNHRFLLLAELLIISSSLDKIYSTLKKHHPITSHALLNNIYFAAFQEAKDELTNAFNHGMKVESGS